MSIKKWLVAGAFLSLVAAAAPASAQITYTGSDTESNVRVDYSITTDGTLGDLDLNNIITSSVTFTGLATGDNPHNFSPYTTTDALYFTGQTPGYGNGVSATATDLFFDFGGGGDLNLCGGNLCYAFASAHTNEYGSVVYHNVDRSGTEVLPTKELDDFANDKVQFYLNSGAYTQVAATNQSFATAVNAAVSAAPEPSTWSLMILGIGALGATMRRKRQFARATLAS